MRPTPGTTSPASTSIAPMRRPWMTATPRLTWRTVQPSITRWRARFGGRRGGRRRGRGCRGGGLLRLHRAGHGAARRLRALCSRCRLRAVDTLEPLVELRQLRGGVAVARLDARLDRADLGAQRRDRVAHRGEVDRRRRRLRRVPRANTEVPSAPAIAPSAPANATDAASSAKRLERESSATCFTGGTITGSSSGATGVLTASGAFSASAAFITASTGFGISKIFGISIGFGASLAAGSGARG